MEQLLKRLFSLIICSATMAVKGQNPSNADKVILATLNHISSLSTYTGIADQIFIKDSLTGGFFYRYDGTLPVDGGIVIKDKAGVRWKRYMYDNRIRPEWFGASPELVDNYAPFMKALNYIYATYNTSGRTIPDYANGVLQLSGVRYNFKRTLVFNKHIKIEGEGTRYEPTTILYFPKNTVGLKFLMTKEGGGFSVDMKNVMVGMDFITEGYDSSAHAIALNCVVNFENVAVNFASGDGIHIDACANPSAVNYGMSDGSRFLNCKIQHSNNGVYINGCDANQIVFQSLWTVANRRWGIYDNGFLGNHYYAPQCDYNGNNESVVSFGNPVKYYLAIQPEELVNINQLPNITNSQFWKEVAPRASRPWNSKKRYYTGGPYAIVNINAYSTVVGAYSEEGQAPAVIQNRVISIGGDQGSGVVGGKYIFANNDGLLLTSSLILTGTNKLGIGTFPEAPLDLNYKYNDSYIPYAGRFKCDDCESTNLMFSNSSSNYGVLGYNKKSFLTIVNHVPVTSIDTTGFYPLSNNLFNLGKNDLRWNDIYANNWKGGIIKPKYGGTGLSEVMPYALLVGGNSAVDNLKQVQGTGNIGEVLTSNGSDKLPSWKKSSAIPVITKTERDAIKNPAIGTIIYNLTTDKINIFTAKGWKQINAEE